MIYKGLSALILAISLLIPSLSRADSVRCVERPISGSITVHGWVHFLNSGGDSTAATSKEAKIIRDGQTATFATVADGSFVQSADRPGFYWIPVTIASTDTLGLYTITGRGTLEADARDGDGESFELKAKCPWTPTVIVIDSTNTSAQSLIVDSGSAGVILANGDYIGKTLECHREYKVITGTTQGVPDNIHLGLGVDSQFIAAPGNGSDETCYIH